MMILDLVFIVLFLTAVVILITALWRALRGEFDRARRILFRLLLGAAAYMAIVIAVSVIMPRRTIPIGDTQCFDDWCVSIADFKQAPKDADLAYTVDLRLSSRARRISQRENNLAVYLTDGMGRRFDPVNDKSSAPLNVLLRPQESVVVSRS